MTANAIYAAVAVGFFLLACLVGWQLVLTLQQVRKTAQAMEQLLVGTRPRIEAVTEEIGSFMSRANRMAGAIEDRWGAAGSFGTGLSQAITGLRVGTEIVATISAAYAMVSRAWSSFWRPAPDTETRAATEGATHA